MKTWTAGEKAYAADLNSNFAALTKFGGNGSDGALVITSGTTTIDCAGAGLVIKNYTSISITGTGKLAFSNPHAKGTTIILRSQGNVTLTSSTVPNIDATGMGAQGGTPNYTSNGNIGAGGGGSSIINNGTGGASGGSGEGSGNAGYSGMGNAVTGGGPGGLQNGCGGGITYGCTWWVKLFMLMTLIPGAGGGSGTGCNMSSGNGGRGGGVLLIECGGALNFTGTIWAKGADGIPATFNANWASGGSGGGGGGMALLIYNALTANSGTFTVTGGLGSQGTSGNALYGGYGGNGGLGFSLVALNTEFD